MSTRGNFRYRYKKTFAIFFATAGLALYAMNVIAMAIAGYLTGPFDIISILITIWAYMMILSGNIQSNDYAYNGVGMFILWTTISYIISYFTSFLNLVSSLWSGSPQILVLSILVFLFLGGAVTCGVLSYVRIRQYLTGRYNNYERVRNWTLAFVICLAISSSLYPFLIIFTYMAASYQLTWYVFVISIAPYISDICIAIACYFTVLRLRATF